MNVILCVPYGTPKSYHEEIKAALVDYITGITNKTPNVIEKLNLTLITVGHGIDDILSSVSEQFNIPVDIKEIEWDKYTRYEAAYQTLDTWIRRSRLVYVFEVPIVDKGYADRVTDLALSLDIDVRRRMLKQTKKDDKGIEDKDE